MLTALVCSVSMLSACGSPQEPSSPRAPAAQPATVRLFASAAAAPVGSRISVSLSGTTADGAPVLGIDGWLRFAPAALRFAGRAVDSTTTIAVNDSGAARGRLRVLAVRPGRLEPDLPVLVFEVLQADYLANLEFAPGAVVGAARQLQRSSGLRRAEVRNSLSAPGAVRAAVQRGKALKNLVTPTIYGDADGSGAVMQADADLVGDWIVGNGAPPDTMTFNIANVAPQNLPGIGGSTDDDPPGWGFLFPGGGFIRQAALTDPPISQGCDRGLAVDDLLLIAQEAGGTNVEVPGEVMPAGSQRPARCGTASWPTLTTTYPSFDTTRLASAGSGAEFYRTAASLTFQVSATDQEKLAVVSKYSLTVVGVTPSGSVFVTFPDPGPAIADLWRLMDSLRSEAAVAGAGAVLRSPLEEGTFGRYPEDGAGLNRTSWTGSSTSTWALRAVRAPLAWGCETGTYSASTVRAAIVEWKHDRDHPELSQSTPVLWEPSDSNLQNESPKPADTVATRRAHATHVAGAMAAIGDNGSGVAGVIWRTDLRLYSVYSNGNRPLPLTTAFYVLTDAIQADRPVVLSLSIDGILPAGLPQAQKDYWIDNTVVYLKDLLQAVPEMLVVVASGNERFRGTASAYEQGARVALVRAALLRLRADPVFGSRIVVVAGTRPGNNLWDISLGDPSEGSNVFAGLTDIAAPAESVLVLGLRSGQSSPLVFKHGTSLAAPIAAGVAAQLLTMDPTLPPAQVKQYVLLGAQQPKPDPATGAATPAQPVQGAPQTIYQLDAYGSLTLLARERNAAPVCGNRVWAASDTVFAERSTGSQVLFVRPGATFAGERLRQYHGGRSMLYGANVYSSSGGQWIQDPQPPADLNFTGSSQSAFGLSHQADTGVRARQIQFNPSPLVEFELYDPVSNATLSTIAQLPGAFAGGGPGALAGNAFSPTSKLVLLNVTRRTVDGVVVAREVYKATLPAGQPSLLFSLPLPAFDLIQSISEDGAEVAVSYNSTASECVIEFRSVAAGSATRPAISYPSTNGSCTYVAGFAPIRAARTGRAGPVQRRH